MPKNKKVTKRIRREIINGHYYIVHRERGRYVSRIRSSSLKNAITKFRQDGDIRPNTQVTTLTNMREVSFTKPINGKVRPSRGRSYQYWVHVQIDGVKTFARSPKHSGSYPVGEARDEALVNAYQIATGYGKHAIDVNDEDVSIANDGVLNEGWVYYRAKV